MVKPSLCLWTAPGSFCAQRLAVYGPWGNYNPGVRGQWESSPLALVPSVVVCRPSVRRRPLSFVCRLVIVLGLVGTWFAVARHVKSAVSACAFSFLVGCRFYSWPCYFLPRLQFVALVETFDLLISVRSVARLAVILCRILFTSWVLHSFD